MIKHLHFLFASILMLAFGVSASAQDVVFDFTPADSYKMFGLTGVSNGSSSNGDITEEKTVTNGEVTLTVSPNTETTTTNRIWETKSGMELRLYGNTKFVLTANKNITNINFTGTVALTANNGTVKGSKWTGESNSVEFTVTKTNKFKTIEITFATEGSVDPEPTPGETTEIYSVLFDSQENIDTWTKEGGMAKNKDFATFDAGKSCVALSQYEDNGTTYFISPAMTLGESNNTVSFENTEFAFENDDAAAHTDLVIRTTDGAAWEKIEGAKFGNNWKEFISSGDLAVPAKYNGKEVQFAFECRFNQAPTGGSGYLYVKSFKVMCAQSATPDPEPQPTEPVVILEESFATSLGQFTTEENTLWSWESNAAKMQGNGVERTEPSYLISPVINVAEQGTISFSHYKNWDWTYNMGTKAGLYIRTVNGTWTSIEGVEYPAENKDWGGKTVDVLVNIPAEYGNKDIQIALGYKCASGDQTTWFVSNFVVKGIPGTAEPVDPQPTETIAENIAAFNALCVKDGVDVTLKLVDAQVLYVNQYTDKKGNDKQEVFVRDASGSVMFYNAGLTVKAGDVMNGEVKGSAKDFFGTKEFCSNADTDLTAITITDGEAAAEEKAITEVTETEVSNLVLVRDVTMISKEETDSKGNVHTNYYLVDANGNELAYYNKFKIEGLDASLFIEKESHIFVGIITLNYGKLQLCPTEQPVATSIDCIDNVELDINAPMYNVAGQKVNANYKGIVLQNGKKFINK